MAKILIKVKNNFYDSGNCTMYFKILTEKYKNRHICAIEVLKEGEKIHQWQFYTHTGGIWMEPNSRINQEKFIIEITN